MSAQQWSALTMQASAIEKIHSDDPVLTAALEAAGLPVDDLVEPGRHFFRFADGDKLIGFIGWELNDDGSALLRSLVVMPSERGQGAGKTMVSWALARLAELVIADVFILTTTAEAFALKLGFVRCERHSAPQSIRESRQFAGLCPASAALLVRRPIPGLACVPFWG
jgi:N-acetylglutamate synthase-like GNAT family acetyltransferase